VPRLLLVEDDETIGGVLCTELAEQRHSVAWARTGAEALRAVRAKDFALVVLDLGLPDIDGCRPSRRASCPTRVSVANAV
jgi:DNA-binding response OmpR family regulator